jgi:ArsR family transcriptional regulator
MEMNTAVELFKSLGESTRLRMVYLLAVTKGKELCNCEFVDALEEPQPNISRHLKVLTQAGIIRERREGRWIYYSLASDESVVDVLGTLVVSLKDPLFREDMVRLRERLASRQEGRCVLGVQKTYLISGSPLSTKKQERRSTDETRSS